MDARRLLTPLLALSLALPAAAQTSGFQPGELLHYNPFATGSGPGSGAIQRLDPLTGQVGLVKALTEAQFRPGSMCFDPFRDRVLFYGKPAPGPQFMRLHALTADGQTTDLGFESEALQLLTPGAGGKIYLHDETTGSGASPLRYLDANDVRHDLLDASGSQPFNQAGLGQFSAMGYEPDLNALLVAIRSDAGAVLCAGGSLTQLTLLRLDLSADGTRVVNSTCTQTLADPLGGNYPVGLSRMGDGSWLLAIDTNSNAAQPRLQRVDPATLAVSSFASNGPYTGAAVTDAACWSGLRGEALLLDNFNARVWSFAPAGSGAILPTSQPLVFGGLYGFPQTLIEVPPAGCASTVGTYCTAKMTSNGCVPALATAGAPNASSPSGFVITATQVLPAKVGLMFYGTSGAASIPFQGGFLCVQTPITRTSGQVSTGSGACGGSFAFDFNAYTASGVDPNLQAGSVVSAQFWFRDPAHPIAGSGLSDAVRFTLCP